MKYKLTNETMEWCGHTLYRIECTEAFANVKVGDKGGWVESKKMLSQEGNCWLYGNAKVYSNARVYDNARVYGNSVVLDNARVYGNSVIMDSSVVCNNARVYGSGVLFDSSVVCDNARVYGYAIISGKAHICGDAIVSNNQDYIVFKNFWSSYRYFTWTKSNNMWKVGCFYGTGEELIKKAYKDSKTSGKYYKTFVNIVNNNMHTPWYSIVKEKLSNLFSKLYK